MDLLKGPGYLDYQCFAGMGGLGIGPVLSYITKIWGKDLVAEVKWLPELDVKNRLEGDYIWFKLGMAF